RRATPPFGLTTLRPVAAKGSPPIGCRTKDRRAPQWRPNFGCSAPGHSLWNLPVIELTVEVAVGFAGRPKVLPLVADENGVFAPGVQFQLHLEPAQSQVDLVEIVVDANRSVLAHHPLDARIEEPIQIQVRVQGPQQR